MNDNDSALRAFFEARGRVSGSVELRISSPDAQFAPLTTTLLLELVNIDDDDDATSCYWQGVVTLAELAGIVALAAGRNA